MITFASSNKKKNNMDEKSKIPTPVISLIPLFVLVALLAMVIPIFGGDALLGGSQVSLLIASSVCVGIAMIKYNYKWSSLEEGMAKNIKKVTPAIIILLLIGAISGTWMLSGIVPTLIYYGLHTLTPQIFLASCCLICAIVSVITGSSWTTIATIGVALLGIGKAQGFEAGWIAGAIISGAYFGDKISPLSDTTVLASSTTGTKLFTHIRSRTNSPVCRYISAKIQFIALASPRSCHYRNPYTHKTSHHYHTVYILGHCRNMHTHLPTSYSPANRTR